MKLIISKADEYSVDFADTDVSEFCKVHFSK